MPTGEIEKIIIGRIETFEDVDLTSVTLHKDSVYYFAGRIGSEVMGSVLLVDERRGIIPFADILIRNDVMLMPDEIAFLKNERETTIKTPFSQVFPVTYKPLSQGEVNDLFYSYRLLCQWYGEHSEPFDMPHHPIASDDENDDEVDDEDFAGEEEFLMDELEDEIDFDDEDMHSDTWMGDDEDEDEDLI